MLKSHLDPDSEPNDSISLPRNIKVDGIIDTKIVNLGIVSTISRWIDRMVINNKFAHLRELYFAIRLNFFNIILQLLYHTC